MTNLMWIYATMTLLPTLFLVIMVFFGFDHQGFDADGHMEIGGGEVEIPNKLSVKLILSFIVGFGALGLVAVYYKWIIPHYIAGLVGGFILWYIVYKLFSFVYKQQSNTQPIEALYVGCIGTVTTPIPTNGLGEIQATNSQGLNKYFNAKAVDPEEKFERGEKVEITSVHTGMVLVKRYLPTP